MKNLRKRRILAGLTQQRLARLTHVDRSKISLVETGQLLLTPEEDQRVLRAVNVALRKQAVLLRKIFSHRAPGGSIAVQRIANGGNVVAKAQEVVL